MPEDSGSMYKSPDFRPKVQRSLYQLEKPKNVIASDKYILSYRKKKIKTAEIRLNEARTFLEINFNNANANNENR